MEQALTDARPVKGYRGMGMQGVVARWYASLTRKSMDEFKALAARVAERLEPGSRVLEVAPGPGYFAIELGKLGKYSITGIDISSSFVDIARANAREARVFVEFRQGNAAALPFEDASFDFILCRAAFKNFTEPLRALREMHRVLTRGGSAMIIDLRKDATPESLDDAVEQMHLGTVNSAITKFTFRHMLLKRAYSKRQFEQFLDQTLFWPIEITESAIGLELLLHKS